MGIHGGRIIMLWRGLFMAGTRKQVKVDGGIHEEKYRVTMDLPAEN